MPALRFSFIIVISFLILQTTGAGDGPCSEVSRIQLKDGRALSFREYGCRNGKLVLYFHGINSSRYEPEVFGDEVCQSKVRLIAIDRPGMGESTFYPERTILDWVDDVKELVSALGYRGQRFGIIGESGGASYACACAAKIPHRITHLALVSGYSPLDVPGVEPGVLDRSIRLVAKHQNLGKATVSARTQQIYRNPRRVTKALTRKWAEVDKKMLLGNEDVHLLVVKNLKSAWGPGPEGIVVDISLLRHHWGFEVCEIKGVSVSVWSGGVDTVVTPSMAKYFHRQIKGSSLLIGPNEGHATMLKNYASAILEQF